MNKELLSLMEQRDDGEWGRLATAAGSAFAVEETLSNLSPAALLNRKTDTSVRRSVEALAAFDVQLLQQVAKTWPLPGAFLQNGLGSARAVFIDAWRSAMRFLPTRMQHHMMLGEIPAAWEEERVALIDPPPEFKSWSELVDFAHMAGSYADLRATDRSVFPGSQISEVDVEALMEVPARGRWSGFQALRVLRFAIGQLDKNARQFVLELAEAAWSEFFGDSPAQLIFFELARPLDADGTLAAMATEHLSYALIQAAGPRHLLESAYLVSGTGWMTP